MAVLLVTFSTLRIRVHHPCLTELEGDHTCMPRTQSADICLQQLLDRPTHEASPDQLFTWILARGSFAQKHA